MKGTEITGRLEKTIGLWGTAEPSFRATLKGAADAIIDIAKRWATDHKQEAMALLFPDKDGEGGILSWNFGRRLTNQDWSKVLYGVRLANERYKQQRLLNPALPNVVVGLTIRSDFRRVEYWAGDGIERDIAEHIIADAMEVADLATNEPIWQSGYRRLMLWKGSDYLAESLRSARGHLQMEQSFLRWLMIFLVALSSILTSFNNFEVPFPGCV